MRDFKPVDCVDPVEQIWIFSTPPEHVLAFRQEFGRDPFEKMEVEGDRERTTRHYFLLQKGLRDLQPTVMCCVSFHPTNFEGEPSWHVHHMTFHPEYMHRGAGRLLLHGAENNVIRNDPARHLLWLKAPLKELTLLRKLGWYPPRSVVYARESQAGPVETLIKRI